MVEANPRETLRIEQLADLREKTEAVSRLLLNQLTEHLETHSSTFGAADGFWGIMSDRRLRKT